MVSKKDKLMSGDSMPIRRLLLLENCLFPSLATSFYLAGAFADLINLDSKIGPLPEVPFRRTERNLLNSAAPFVSAGSKLKPFL